LPVGTGQQQRKAREERDSISLRTVLEYDDKVGVGKILQLVGDHHHGAATELLADALKELTRARQTTESEEHTKRDTVADVGGEYRLGTLNNDREKAY
jgi:hypothetical protein